MKRSLALFGLLVLSLAALASAISPRFDSRAYTIVGDTPIVRAQFTNWARDNGRSYGSQEFNHRYNLWRDNLAFIEHFNANANATFTLGINEFGDMSEDEIVRVYAGLMVPQSVRAAIQDANLNDAEEAQREHIERQVPSSFDWRSSGAVGPIKNQGSCGACYTFSANAAIEGMYKISTGQLPTLSEQMLLDCAQGTGNLGCNGGNMEVTFSWIINNGGGVNTQASYPWTGAQGTCRYNSRNNGATIKAYRRAAAGSEAGLLSLATNGPVAVGINSSPRTFLYYRSGTLSDSSCTASGINHAVTVVGWGTDSNGKAYWLIKNSWGTSWGQSGYAMIARNSGNMCGIASMASQPCYTANCA